MSMIRVHKNLPTMLTPNAKVRQESFTYYEVPEEAYNLIRKRAKSELYNEIFRSVE